MIRSDLTGIILAGGKSSRMGMEKGLVAFRGKPLIQYGIDLLSVYCNRILISSGNPDYLPFKLEMVPDDVSGQGPAAGLASALKYSKTPWNLVIACDLPYLEAELIDTMLESASNCLAVVPIHDGVKEPLAGLYNKNLGNHFEAAVAEGNLAIHRILGSCDVNYLNCQLLVEKFPSIFTNFNTLQDMEACLD